MMKLGVKELIELYIYCSGHPLLYAFNGVVAVWMRLFGNLHKPNIISHEVDPNALQYAGNMDRHHPL